MIIAVEGTKQFSDYELFMNGMAVAMKHPNHNNEIQVWSLGPHKINSFTAAFCNTTENYLKSKGFKVSFSKVHPDWVRQNIEHVSYHAFFSLPKEPLSKFTEWARHQEGLEVGVFRF